MNYRYNPNQRPFDEIRVFFRRGSGLSVLILINLAIWLTIQALDVLLFFYNKSDGQTNNTALLHAFALPAYIPSLSSTPWTLITYMFLHTDIWHILFNMIWLFWFGKIFLEFLPSRQLVLIYLLGGFCGGIVYIVAFNIFPVFASILQASYALGASASVMAIVTAIAVYAPNYSIQLFLIGRLKIIYLAGVLFIFDFFMIPSGNAGGHLAHIGGALFGAVYILLYNYFTKMPYAAISSGFFKIFSNKFRRKKTGGQFHSGNYARPFSDEDYNLKKLETQKKIDDILDKISKGGYDSLTKYEKEFLFNASNKR
jgi:membrane associated rhomboid family serine protease